MKTKKALMLRDEIQKQFFLVPKNERSAYIVNRLTENLDPLSAAFIMQLKARHCDGPYYRILADQLETSISSLHEMCQINNRLKMFARDMYITLGNLLHKNCQFTDAIFAYEQAIKSESNYTRRCLGLINIARSEVSRGYDYRAVEILSALNTGNISNLELVQSIANLKARIWLNMGVEKFAARITASSNFGPIQNSRLELENRYLGLMASYHPEKVDEFFANYEDFLGWVDRCCQESLCFYLLEFELLKICRNPVVVKNKSNTKVRVRYLANKCRNPLVTKIVNSIYESRKERLIPGERTYELFELLKQHAATGNSFSYQIILTLLCTYFLRRRFYQSLKMALDALRGNWNFVLRNYPRDCSEVISLRTSQVRMFQQKMESCLPDKYYGAPNKTLSNWLFTA